MNSGVIADYTMHEVVEENHIEASNLCMGGGRWEVGGGKSRKASRRRVIPEQGEIRVQGLNGPKKKE